MTRWAPKGRAVPNVAATARLWHGYCVGMSRNPAAGVIECEAAVAALRPATTGFAWPRRW